MQHLKMSIRLRKLYRHLLKKSMVKEVFNVCERTMLIVIFYCALFFLGGCGRHYTTHRSPLRKPTYQMPTIVVSGDKTPHSYARTSNHYKKEPIFTVFDEVFFNENQIPPTGIFTVDGKFMIDSNCIDAMLTDILNALKERRPLPHCAVMHDGNFNYSTCCGLLILKLHDYPLVIKLFRETPESFVLPFSKGFEPTTFFFMCGGSNRHIAGLTRIPNRYRMQAFIDSNPYWKEIVRMPRKWYWVPHDREWLRIDGYHIDGAIRLHTEVPATYVIVADYITPEVESKLTDAEKKQLIMDLSTICALHLDPHMKNFIFETQKKTGKPLITIIDTEDQSCMTGLREPMSYNTHIEWYALLTGKFLKNLLFNIKDDPLQETYFS